MRAAAVPDWVRFGAEGRSNDGLREALDDGEDGHGVNAHERVKASTRAVIMVARY